MLMRPLAVDCTGLRFAGPEHTAVVVNAQQAHPPSLGTWQLIFHESDGPDSFYDDRGTAHFRQVFFLMTGAP